MRSSSALKVAMALSGPQSLSTSAAQTNEVCRSGSSGGRLMLKTTDATPPAPATLTSPTTNKPRRQRQSVLRRLAGRRGLGTGAGRRAVPLEEAGGRRWVIGSGSWARAAGRRAADSR